MAKISWKGLVAAALACTGLAQEPAVTSLTTLERRIATGEIHSYPLELEGQRLIRIFFAQVLPFPVTVRLLTPDGATLAERSSRQNILFSTIGPGAGRYMLEVAASRTSAPASGDYRLGPVEIRSPEPGDEELLKADADYTEYRRAAATSSEKAAADLDSAASLYQRINQPGFQGWALLVGGQYRVRLSDYRQAADRYARSAEAFQKAGNRAGRAEALDFLGDIMQVLRDYPKAIEAASEELAIARQAHLRTLEAGALNILGRAYSATGEKQRALEFFHEATVVARSIRDRAREAAVLRSAAALHNSLGDHEKALGLYKEVLAIERERGQKLNEAAALSNLGSSYGSLGQTATAIEYFEQAIELFRATGGGRPALATTLSDGGQAYLDVHQPVKAQPLLEEALAIARETKNRWSEAYALMNLGRARDGLKDSEGAAALLSSALPIARETGDPQLQGLVHFASARVARGRGNLETAREHAAEAIRLTESLRDRVSVPDLRSSLVAAVGNYYEFQVDVLMQLYRRDGSFALAEEARETAERGRARNLMDVLASAGIPRAAAPDAALVQQEQTLRRKLGEISSKRIALQRAKASAQALAAIGREIDETWIEYQTVRAKLMAADPLALAAVSGTASMEALQKETLDANTVLLEFSLGEPRSYLWVISQGGAAAFDLASRSRLEESARNFRDAVKGGRDATEVEREAIRLSQLILGPARGLIANKRLLIVADGALQYVPFGALADPAFASSYRPLIENHEVIGEPSAGALVLLRRASGERKPAARSLAVFADPVFEAEDQRLRGSGREASSGPQPASLTRAAELRLARLPSTRPEAQAIASLVPPSERWLAMDFDASREAAISGRISGYRMLHFATHGVVDSARPEQSALALSLYDSQGRARDGFLRLYEIYNLNIQADLVVLSACDTALGRNVRGEGLIGLARGFMHAGAPRVAASLWKVDDQATSELMRLFYSAMLGPKHKSAAAALREAQLTVARQERWRSPYYWAAFTLQGEWK